MFKHPPPWLGAFGAKHRLGAGYYAWITIINRKTSSSSVLEGRMVDIKLRSTCISCRTARQLIASTRPKSGLNRTCQTFGGRRRDPQNSPGLHKSGVSGTLGYRSVESAQTQASGACRHVSLIQLKQAR